MMFHTAALVTVLAHVELSGFAEAVLQKKARVEFAGEADVYLVKRLKQSPYTEKRIQLKYSQISGVFHPDQRIDVDLTLESGKRIYSSWVREYSNSTSPVVYKIKQRQNHDTYYEESDVEFSIYNRGNINGTYKNKSRTGIYGSDNEFKLSGGPYLDQGGKGLKLSIHDWKTKDIDGHEAEVSFDVSFEKFRSYL